MQDDYYQRIGQAAVTECAGAERILLFSEMEDGVTSADLFFLNPGDEAVQFRFASREFQNLIYESWEKGAGEIQARSWLALTFTIDNGKFDAKFTYPDQVDSEEYLSDRRPLVVESHFPGMKIDYSRPRG